MANASFSSAHDQQCELLSDADLQEVNGGLFSLSAILTPIVIKPPVPIGCPACVQGLPLDVLNNKLVNPVLTVGF